MKVKESAEGNMFLVLVESKASNGRKQRDGKKKKGRISALQESSRIKKLKP